MLLKTAGIVFKSIKYSETSLILDVYTREKGLRKYIVSGVRSKRARISPGILQNGSLIDLVAYERPSKSMNRTKEIKAAYLYQSIPFDLIRGSISLFMVELAQKTIKEESSAPELFDFLYNYFVLLDSQPNISPNFPLNFMLELSSFLGMSPAGKWSDKTSWFDMQEGIYSEQEPLHPYYLSQPLSQQLSKLQHNANISLSNTERRTLLQKLIDYYRLHLDNFHGLNSHEVLREVLEV